MLPGVIRGSIKPPRLVLYGPPKIGKSTLGADMPAPIFVTTEDGVDSLPVDQFPQAANWQKLLENVSTVADGDHDYRTIVIDTINGAANLCASHICDTIFGGVWVSGNGKTGFDSYGKGQMATGEKITELFALLDKCRAKGMTVALLAHTGVQTVKNPVLGDYQKFVPDLAKPVWAKLSAWADIIIRADFDYVVTEDKSTKAKRARGDSTRILIASGSAAEDAGCRVGYHLPERLDMSWASIAEHLGRDANTVNEIRELLHLLDDGQIKKTLAYLHIKSMDELDKAQAERCRVVLNRLKIKADETAESEESDA